MTYNIEGHDELIDSDHAAKIAATIKQFKPDIVGLQEVHDHTWQVALPQPVRGDPAADRR